MSKTEIDLVLARDLYVMADFLCAEEPLHTPMVVPISEIVSRICAKASPVLMALIAVKLASHIDGKCT